MGKTVAKLAGIATLLFAMNGLINLELMKPLAGSSDAINHLRLRLDDAVFILLFIFMAVVFLAMFAVLPRERGYLYLGTISLLTSLQLFWDWEDKTLLIGPFPNIPHGSLLIKSGITFLFFSFASYLLKTGQRMATRLSIWAGGILWLTIAAALLLSAGDSLFYVLNLLFLVHVFLSMGLFIAQFLILLRRKEQQSELRFIGFGFLLFSIVLLPDPVKDLLESLAGHSLGYRPMYGEECLEDTFSWALLSLLTVFGILFFRRFIHTIDVSETVSRELRSKNTILEQEIDTRQRLDQLFSTFLRTYRMADLDMCVIREGRRYFQPHGFALVKHNEATGSVTLAGSEGGSPPEQDMKGVLVQTTGKGMHSGEEIVAPGMVLGAAGGTEGNRLYLVVFAADGGLIRMEERDKFALRLMAKYVSLFYEYFQLIESRFRELEQQQAERAPWLSRLFMQIAEKERKRLASDLHDEVLQELLHLRRLLDRAAPGQLQQLEQTEQLRIGLENAEFMIRETCSELMPSFLSDHGVLHAVARLVEKTRLRADFQLEFQANPVDAALSDEQMTTVYRVVQELITNAVKHSEASRVTLCLGEQGRDLLIDYSDNGKGMDTDHVFSSTNRLGLRGMLERIRMLGGEVEMTSEPGQGVKVHCALPL